MLPEEPYIHVNYQPVEIPVSDPPESKTALLKRKNNGFSKSDFVPEEKHEQADEDLLSQYQTNNPTVGKKEWPVLTVIKYFGNRIHTYVISARFFRI